MFTRDLFEVCDGNHVMLVYEDENAQLDAAVHFLNEGLKANYLCIYASVYAFDAESKLSVSNLSSKIIDFETNIENGNLQFIDFKGFYDSASESNLSPFVKLQHRLETVLKDRIASGKGDKIIVFADAACCLTENRKFEESNGLETWWQHTHSQWISNDNKITVICPHPAQVLREELEVKWRIADVHDIMIFLNSHFKDGLLQNVKKSNLRILIAESEPDLLTLYSDYISSMGHDVSVVTDGNKCFSLYKKRDFDIIILDTHLTGGLEVKALAKEIKRIDPHQKMIITTTSPSSLVSDGLRNVGLQLNDILQKPFHLSKLANVISQQL